MAQSWNDYLLTQPKGADGKTQAERGFYLDEEDRTATLKWQADFINAEMEAGRSSGGSGIAAMNPYVKQWNGATQSYELGSNVVDFGHSNGPTVVTPYRANLGDDSGIVIGGTPTGMTSAQYAATNQVRGIEVGTQLQDEQSQAIRASTQENLARQAAARTAAAPAAAPAAASTGVSADAPSMNEYFTGLAGDGKKKNNSATSAPAAEQTVATTTAPGAPTAAKSVHWSEAGFNAGSGDKNPFSGTDLDSDPRKLEGIYFSANDFQQLSEGHYQEIGDSGQQVWNDARFGVSDALGNGSNSGSNYEFQFDAQGNPISMIDKNQSKAGARYDLVKDANGNYTPKYVGQEHWDTNPGEMNKGIVAGLAMLAGGALAYGGMAGGAAAGAGGAAEAGLTAAEFAAFDAAQLTAQGLGVAQVEATLVASGLDAFIAADVAQLAAQGLNAAAITQNAVAAYGTNLLGGAGALIPTAGASATGYGPIGVEGTMTQAAPTVMQRVGELLTMDNAKTAIQLVGLAGAAAGGAAALSTPAPATSAGAPTGAPVGPIGTEGTTPSAKPAPVTGVGSDPKQQDPAVLAAIALRRRQLAMRRGRGSLRSDSTSDAHAGDIAGAIARELNLSVNGRGLDLGSGPSVLSQQDLNDYFGLSSAMPTPRGSTTK